MKREKGREREREREREVTGGDGEVQFLEFGVRLDLFSPSWVNCSLLGLNSCTVGTYKVNVGWMVMGEGKKGKVVGSIHIG